MSYLLTVRFVQAVLTAGAAAVPVTGVAASMSVSGAPISMSAATSSVSVAAQSATLSLGGWPFSLPAVQTLGTISSNVLTDITPTGGSVSKVNEDFSLPKVLGAWGSSAIVLQKTAGVVTDVLYVIFGGGHSDTGNDGVYAWRASTGRFESLLAPSTVTATVTSDTTNGENIANRPASQHVYNHIQGLNSDEANGPSLMQLYGSGIGSGAIISGRAHKFDTSTGSWSRYGDVAGGLVRSTAVTIKDTARQKFFRFPGDSGTAFYSLDYTAASPTWQTLSQSARIGNWSDTFEAVGIYDPTRDLYIAGRFGAGASGICALDATAPTGSWVLLTLTGDAITATYGMGLCYRSATDTFILIEAAATPTAYYEITPPTSSPLTNAWTVVRKTFTGTSRFTNLVNNTAEWFHRWQYVNFPTLGDALIACPAAGYPMEAIKL